ncbi:MAG: bifunctional glycosyltransferase family 2/GtrA family protein [Oscillospiraceae bacterium]|jgi:glycosyltransferase involved in cell wall biosynthesis|nr:bifunctional glycosyltransferase family 2/GtrA family protein [Oscillospiraceae bacterium]
MRSATAPGGATILIPAYKPDRRLVSLVDELRGRGLDVLVVDDGSGAAYSDIFQQARALGADVVSHAVNLGKGRALKTGLNALMLRYGARDVVTADADGQHTAGDILKVAALLERRPGALALGVRAFAGKAPLKSLVGNGITRLAFTWITGVRCRDTQTGLRGLPASSLPDMMRLPGERYEYEMNMLLQLKEMKLELAEEPIETVYIDGNKGSHFNALRDAARIMAALMRFGLSSVISLAADWLLYAAFLGAGLGFGFAYASARVISALLNFTLNRTVVFRKGGRRSALRYAALAVAQMIAGALLTHLLSSVSPRFALWVKLPVDALLFIINFYVQREWIFTD